MHFPELYDGFASPVDPSIRVEFGPDRSVNEPYPEPFPFSKDQLKVLNNAFASLDNVTAENEQNLAHQLGVSPESVHEWFASMQDRHSWIDRRRIEPRKPR